MTTYAYKVVPAPKKAVRAKGVKGTEARFANALEVVMNEMGAQGWEYQRTDTLPCEERAGLTGRTTTFQNMLVFRRAIESDAALAPRELDAAPIALVAPAPLAAIAKPEADETPDRVADTLAQGNETAPDADMPTVDTPDETAPDKPNVAAE